MKPVRVRFAPSPTGGLHLGGVRTALYNYLFAKQQGGNFVLRLEDTDQTRFVEGAEEYILRSLEWCGILPDEGPHQPGTYGPYRQTERKDTYRKYAEQLVQSGHAYYAFDTPEEIENMREKLKAEGKHNLQYNFENRLAMRNSLSLAVEETQKLLKESPYVIRLKVEPDITVKFRDIIRGEIEMDTHSVDDKVLLKADGMPTYHLAVVVDDHLMKITHSFRGEEWLPGAPVHILLWKYLGWEGEMPQWAHLPLILKPDGNGKLSKRDGQRLGFPVFPLAWNDPRQGLQEGFAEIGFLPEAFINMLAMLGWNDGTSQEIFSLDELVEKFSLERVQTHGAKFDFEKAKWFNHEWIKKSSASHLATYVKPILENAGLDISDHDKLLQVIDLVKERCILLTDFVEQSSYFFVKPQIQDLSGVQPKWDPAKDEFFEELISKWSDLPDWSHDNLAETFKELTVTKEIKAGQLLAPLRIMLVGGKFGPGVYDIATMIGKDETLQRITTVAKMLKG